MKKLYYTLATLGLTIGLVSTLLQFKPEEKSDGTPQNISILEEKSDRTNQDVSIYLYNLDAQQYQAFSNKLELLCKDEEGVSEAIKDKGTNVPLTLELHFREESGNYMHALYHNGFSSTGGAPVGGHCFLDLDDQANAQILDDFGYLGNHSFYVSGPDFSPGEKAKIISEVLKHKVGPAVNYGYYTSCGPQTCPRFEENISDKALPEILDNLLSAKSIQLEFSPARNDGKKASLILGSNLGGDSITLDYLPPQQDANYRNLVDMVLPN
jgi:hypothetical protein